jgi:hypothetical protein
MRGGRVLCSAGGRSGDGWGRVGAVRPSWPRFQRRPAGGPHVGWGGQRCAGGRAPGRVRQLVLIASPREHGDRGQPAAGEVAQRGEGPDRTVVRGGELLVAVAVHHLSGGGLRALDPRSLRGFRLPLAPTLVGDGAPQPEQAPALRDRASLRQLVGVDLLAGNDARFERGDALVGGEVVAQLVGHLPVGALPRSLLRTLVDLLMRLLGGALLVREPVPLGGLGGDLLAHPLPGLLDALDERGAGRGPLLLRREARRVEGSVAGSLLSGAVPLPVLVGEAHVLSDGAHRVLLSRRAARSQRAPLAPHRAERSSI